MISVEDTYPGRSIPASAAYPEGAIKNETVPNVSDDGTPLDHLWANDIEALKQAVMLEAGDVPTVPGNIPDTALSSQWLTGFKNILGQVYKSKSLAAAGLVNLTAADAGRSVFITSDDGGHFTVKHNVTPGTYSDNGGVYAGTIFIPTGGDGTIGLVRDYDGDLWSNWFGASPSASTSVNDAAFQAAIDAANTLGVGGDVRISVGVYSYATTLVLYNDVGFVGSGQTTKAIIGGTPPAQDYKTILDYSGTGNAIEALGTFSPFDVRSNINIGGFRLVTHSSATNGLHVEFLTRFRIFDIYFDGIPTNAQLNMLSSYNGTVERCFVKGGQTYNLNFDISATDPVFSGQTRFVHCDFWSGGIGTRVAQPSQIMAQLTFDTCHWQSNDRGFEHVGGRPPVLINPHFENNTDSDFRSTGLNSALIYGGYCNSPTNTAGRISIDFQGRDGVLEGMGFNEHVIGDCVKLTGDNNVVRSCNFRQVSGSTRTGLRVAGDNNRAEDNSFINDVSGSQDCVTIDSGASRTMLGKQHFDSSVVGGRVTNNDATTILIDREVKRTDQIALDGGAYRIAFPSFGRTMYLTDAKVVYPSAIAGGSGASLEIGRSTAPNTNSSTAFLSATSEIATGSFSETDETGSLAADKSLGASDILNVNSDGAEVVAATAMIEIGLLPYRLFD